MIKVKPAEGLLVRDPQTRQVLPPEGGEVSDNNFWRRRLAAGDVVAIEAPQVAEQTEQADPNEDKDQHVDQLQHDSK